MAGPSLYGSFRTGLSFGSGDASVADIGSRWGFKGSHEVSEGLTASYKYESKFNTTNAESSGGAGHTHAAADESDFYQSRVVMTMVPGQRMKTSVDEADRYGTFTNACNPW